MRTVSPVRGRLWLIPAALVLVLIGVATVFLGVSPAEPSPTSAAGVCQAVQRLSAQRHDDDPVTRGTSTMVVLGDSYAQGAGLTDPRSQSWPTLVGRAAGRTTIVDAVGGSGFVNEGPCGDQAFPARLAGVLAREPSTVVVQGGVNDTWSDEQRVRDGARAVLQGLRGVPTVVVLGPTAPPAVDRARVLRVDAVLREVAAAERRQYVSAVDWQLPYVSDRLHPTVQGQQEFARLFTNSIVPG